jgi:hypothetical protein
MNKTPRLGKKRSPRSGAPQLGKSRRGKAGARLRKRPPKPRRVKPTTDPAEAGHRLQGRKASDIEWATYKALRSLGYGDKDISFQVSIFGGRMRRGGQVLDFVIQRDGGPSIVIDVRGEYFHRGTAAQIARDREKRLRLLAEPRAPRMIIIWESEAHNWTRLRRKLIEEVGFA